MLCSSHNNGSTRRARRDVTRGFSLAELLVVIGIIALLIAIVLAPLRNAHRHAVSARCAAQLGQIGIALENAITVYKYYPLPDDGGRPVRYTWIDVLVEQADLSNVKSAYCPADPRPGDLNAARSAQHDLRYPGSPEQPGIDYSYGISVPLSSGRWHQGNMTPPPSEDGTRYPLDYTRYTSNRVLAADGNWNTIYNLSGNAILSGEWSDPTQFDNTVAWRHGGPSANVLYQDGHVSRLRYQMHEPEPVNTTLSYLWFPGEPIFVSPAYDVLGPYYPDVPESKKQKTRTDSFVPEEMDPLYYTENLLWTQIHHK